MMNSVPQLDLAEYLADTHFPNDAVQPLEIAEHYSITSSVGHYEEAFDGLLEVQNDQFHIYLNQDRLINSKYPRARFTAAHELGHYFIDDHRQALMSGVKPHPSFTEFVTNSIAEHQADEFAAALLMPTGRFGSAAKRRAATLATIVELAELFGTSMMSTAIRYARSDVASTTVMFWAETERRWCWSSSDMWDITHNKAHRSTSAVPEGSNTKLLLSSANTNSTEERATVLSQWFPFVKAGSSNDKICREEAIRLGNFGVLTLLAVC